MNLIRKLSRLNSTDRRLLVQASIVLFWTRLLLWLLPWEVATAGLAKLHVPGSIPMTPERGAWAVRNASRVVPRATCLTQALALQHLLMRAGHTPRLTLGVSKGTEGFEAHAWVEHEGEPLLNERDEISRYARLLTMEGL